MTALLAAGASRSDALLALVPHLEADGRGPLIVDYVESGLDGATQAALADRIRRRPAGARPLVLLTRSDVILDLAAASPSDTIFYCPANHAPPMRVAPHPGAPGYEALASCLASPEVRARTAGLVATIAV